MRSSYSTVTAFLLVFLLSNGCVDHKLPAPLDCNDDPVLLELVSVTDADCALQNGTVEVAASGGTGNYQFRLGDSEPQTASVFINVGAGSYEVAVADENNCSATIEAVVQNKNGLNITVQTTDAGCKGFDGTITVEGFNGVEPYQFLIDDSSFDINNSFAGLPAGNYKVVAKDDTGCELSQTVRVKSGISYSTTIEPIIETNCIVSGCHNGSQFPDFRNFANIQANASQIKTLTGNRTMPEDGVLTQGEIDMIACWVDDGAPAN